MFNLLKEIEGTNKMSFPVFQKSLHFLPHIVNVLFRSMFCLFLLEVIFLVVVQYSLEDLREVLFCTRNI